MVDPGCRESRPGFFLRKSHVTDDGKTVRMSFAEYHEWVKSLLVNFQGGTPVSFGWDGPREVYIDGLIPGEMLE